METVCDLVEQLGGFRATFGRSPNYYEFYGLFLCKKRLFHARCAHVAYGVAIALGLVDPGMEYYRSLTDGEAEARLLKAQQDTLRKRLSG